jgi:hypothetical protein
MMGDEDKIDTMLREFKNWMGPLPGVERYPYFDKHCGYFLVRKGDTFSEEVSDTWDGFKAGWLAREGVDERTVEGW